MWHRVDMVLTDVSEERIAFIFRVEGKLFHHRPVIYLFIASVI
jgi:hypothetical protein